MIVVPFNQHLPQQFPPSNIKPDTAVTYNSNENFGIITLVVEEKQTTQKKTRRVKNHADFYLFYFISQFYLECVLFKSICFNINEIVWYVYVPNRKHVYAK